MGVVDMERIQTFIRRTAGLRIPLYAANVCYFLVLSLFPGLLLALASLRFTSLRATDLIILLEALVPAALMPSVERLIVSTYYNSTGTVVSVSALAALWSASRCIYGLMAGLNRVYGVREDRGYLHTRLLSAVYMFLLLMVMTLTLVLHVFGTNLIALLENSDAPAARILIQMVDLRLVILLFAQTIVFTLVYMVLPNKPNRFRDSLPGAVGAALGWQIFSKLFSVYVRYFSGYANIYGSLYAMALGMLWLYCCTLILLFGGAVNRFLTSWEKY